MEMRQKALDLSDDDAPLIHHDPHPALSHTALQEIPDCSDNPDPHPSIQLKYYHEYRKIYLTSFKLWGEISKQVRLKEDLTARIVQLEVITTVTQNQLVSLHKHKRHELPEEEEP